MVRHRWTFIRELPVMLSAIRNAGVCPGGTNLGSAKQGGRVWLDRVGRSKRPQRVRATTTGANLPENQKNLKKVLQPSQVPVWQELMR